MTQAPAETLRLIWMVVDLVTNVQSHECKIKQVVYIYIYNCKKICKIVCISFLTLGLFIYL